MRRLIARATRNPVTTERSITADVGSTQYTWNKFAMQQWVAFLAIEQRDVRQDGVLEEITKIKKIKSQV
ncbi:18084_t:CDS:2 [Acaulospora morrowiae]|uniref:18084_t:CDS:1 n=1 Tax=Acaulospora morrowiae TaxID=94023 RepID=A0A9N9CQY9_9GLOM|nr:18084_t:CDS:2 [Acaulospora morrowiae]